MHKVELPEARHSGGFENGAVPVPNVLFDELLPTLRDTELRVLLVVLRQTLGWRDKAGRSKARDWLSHAQLVRRTGRGSDAVSQAVAALVSRGLIVVETSDGARLHSPEERRRHLGRLYFRPTLLPGDNRGKRARRSIREKPKEQQTSRTKRRLLVITQR